MGKKRDDKDYVIDKKVKVVCTQCLHGFHDECIGKEGSFQVACHCMWNKHKI